MNRCKLKKRVRLSFELPVAVHSVPHNTRLHLTKPFVTHRACARSAPNVFAGEAHVILVKKEDVVIPKAVRTIVGDVVGGYYYSHRMLDSLFYDSGAPGDPPAGNCSDKVSGWLNGANGDPDTDEYAVLGKTIEEFMEVDSQVEARIESQHKGRLRIQAILAKYGLSYAQGGRINGGTTGAATRSLEDILRDRDIPGLNIEFDRALMSIETDPPAAVTASCAILESLFKVIIEDEGLNPPSKQSVKPLWSVVQKHLNLKPTKAVEEDDLIRILSGISSIVDGVGALRTHGGSAHGHGRKNYRIEARHARLVVSSAHAISAFVLEVWEQTRTRRASQNN